MDHRDDPGALADELRALAKNSPCPDCPGEIYASCTGITVIGFLNHEQVELRAQALAAGCSEVLTKGQLSAGLAGLLRRVLA